MLLHRDRDSEGATKKVAPTEAVEEKKVVEKPKLTKATKKE